MLCPSSPEAFPIPLGKYSDLDCNKIEVEATAEAHKKTTFALNTILSLVSASITRTPDAFFVSGS